MTGETGNGNFILLAVKGVQIHLLLTSPVHPLSVLKSHGTVLPALSQHGSATPIISC